MALYMGNCGYYPTYNKNHIQTAEMMTVRS